MSAGVCVDSLNHPMHPNTLNRLDSNIVRVELRAEQPFIDYTIDLDTAGVNLVYLLGPSSPQDQDLVDLLALCPTPKIVILGNEPDIQGASSWSMAPQEFTEFWNKQSVLFPNIDLCAPGTYSPDFMQSVWYDLQIKPKYMNRHYPDVAEDLIVYTSYFGIPLIVGEMCYKTATTQQMHDYIYMLNRYTSYYFWFVANEANHKDMGLLSIRDYPTRAFYNYRSAIK